MRPVMRPRTPMRRSVLLAAMSNLVLLQQPLFAQTYLQPPEYEQVDRNGVDLLSGSATFNVELGSVGSGPGEIKYRSLWFGNQDSNSLVNTLALYDNAGSKGSKDNYSATATFDGSSKTFTETPPSGSQIWVLARGTGATLVYSSPNYVLTLQDGEVRTYGVPSGTSSVWVLVSRVEPNGVTWTYQWQPGPTLGSWRPISVTNNLGFSVSLVYLSDVTSSADWDFVKTVNFYNLAISTTVPVSTASRTRISNGIQAVTTGGQVWNVIGLTAPAAPDTYYSNTQFQVKTPSSSTTNLSYNAVTLKISTLPTVNMHVTTSAVNNGLTYNYDFSMSNATGSYIGETKVTDPLNNVLDLQYTYYTSPLSQAAFPLKVTDPLTRSTQYATNGYIITSVTRPAGDQDVYGYDGRYNVTSITHVAIPGSGLVNRVEYAAFPSSCTNTITCNRPTSTTDANNNTTQYTYDPTHGGVLTETLPAVNGISPVKRYSYVQRYAWISNGAGGYVHAASPVWLKNDERTCRTTATVGNACSGGSADELVNTYEYGPDSGPNNLLLRGLTVSSGGQSLRTCYTYDASGNKISETKPLGTGGSCP